MEPEKGQNVFSPHAVSPIFSGPLEVSALTPPPPEGNVEFTDEDREIVARVLRHATGGDADRDADPPAEGN